MEESLIEHVKSYPLLYDPSSKEYRNHEARYEAWNQIGEKIGLTGEDCKDAWFKLRNAYTNALRRRKVKPGQATKSFFKWKFEDQMSFLATTIEGRVQNHPESENVFEDATEEEKDIKDTDINCDELNREMGSTSVSYQRPPSRLTSDTLPTHVASRKRRVEADFSEMNDISEERNKLQGSQTSFSSDMRIDSSDDETELFFLSLAKSVKKLKPEEQINVKMKISEIIFTAQLRGLRGKDQPITPSQSTSESKE